MSTPDAQIADRATIHDGVVSRSELARIGLSPKAIRGRAARGTLHRVQSAVFAVGHRALTQRARYRAALDTVGPEACLSYFSAAEVHGLIDGDGLRIDVSTPNRNRRVRTGVTLHRPRGLAHEDVVEVGGLCVTSPTRTLLDMASVVGDARLRDMCSRAARAGTYDRLALVDRLGRGRRGSVSLRRVLAALDVGEGHTRSELEHAFRTLVERHRVPPPAFNQRLETADGKVVIPDALWLASGFVVELDGLDTRGNVLARADDVEKDLLYREMGLDSQRLTWRQVVGDDARVARMLTQRLGIVGA